MVLLRYLEAFHLAASVDELFDSLNTLLREEFNPELILFSFIDVRKRQLAYYLPESIRGVSVRVGEGSAGLAVAQGQTVYFNAAISPLPDPCLPAGLELETPLRSMLAVPLVRDSRTVGTIELINRKDGRDFNHSDFEYVDALGPHMAVALNHFVLSEEAKRRFEEEVRLREISQSINTRLDLQGILDDILKSLAGLIPYDAASILLFATDEYPQEMAAYGYFEEETESLVGRSQCINYLWTKTRPLPQILSSHEGDETPSAIRPTTECEILIPLRVGDRLIGIFSLANDQKNAYSEADLELLEAFTGQACLSIERARLHKSAIEKTQLQQELKIAREIQLRFLPRQMPSISRLELAARNVASRGVSGDYYDFISIVPGQWGIVIGDVSGKGISAGLIMSAFRASLLAEIRNNFAISTILAKVNLLLWETTDENRFVTAFYGVFDEQQRILTYSNAGHNPPLLLRPNGVLERLETGGMVLGAFKDSRYVEERVTLSPGDIVLLYTDGLTDSLDGEGESLETEGVERLLRQYSDCSAEAIADAMVDQTTRHSSSGTPEDDSTLVVIKVRDGD